MIFKRNFNEILIIFSFILCCLFSISSFSSDGNVCPVFDDYFLSSGKSDSSFSEYLTQPILERNIFGLREISSRDNIVHIKILEEPLIMEVVIFDAKGNIKIKKTFNSNMSCGDGKIIFSSPVKGSSDGSSVQYSEMTTELFWQEKNTLAVTTSRYSEKRSWIFFRDKNLDIVNYTFPIASLDKIKLTK